MAKKGTKTGMSKKVAEKLASKASALSHVKILKGANK